MITFMNERLNIENKYAQMLHNLAKTGGISNMVSNISMTHSIIDYKNYEEQTMRDAINALINFTIQESELHREFAVQTKTNIVQALDETRKNLSLNKKGWMQKLEQSKRQIKEANDVYKREYTRLQQQAAIVDDLKKKRDDAYRRFGLSLDEHLQFENMPKPIQQAEQKYQDAILKYNEIKKAASVQQEYTEKCVADFNKGSSDILEQIEKQEYQRLEVLKQGLNSFSMTIMNMVHQCESLHKLIELEFSNVDPIKDIQFFIGRNSTFADNERLKTLYKEMGLYQPLNEEQSMHNNDKIRLMGGGLLVEKTSRAMAQQLKQMEEDRKRKAHEDEIHKKEQLKLKKIQALVDQLKGNRETLYKLGNQSLQGGKFDLLYQPRPGVAGEFRIGQKDTLNQLLYLLICLQKPISTNNLKEQFQLSDESTAYLETLIKYLNQFKFTDLFQVLQKMLEYYKNQDSQYEKHQFFDQIIGSKEKEFYKSLLGIVWTWIRLVVLRHNGYNLESYEKEINSFIDIMELEHHSSNQFTSEALEFTFNAIKYIQKIAKKESFIVGYPLNYMLHQNLLSLYIDSKAGSNSKSLLVNSFSDLFYNLQNFSQNFLGVKVPFQLLHIMKIIFNDHLNTPEQNFADYNENQNRALYSMKTLIQKINKEHPNILKQKLISLELIKEKELLEPLDYFSSTNQEPAKLLYRLNNCWLLSDIFQDLFKILKNYETNFGECQNKLRLILDFTSICFKISFVFVSDGSLQQKLKSEVLTKAGDRASQLICENEGFQSPFTLQRNQQGRANILEVINCFTNFLKNQEEQFKKVWDQHLHQSNQPNDKQKQSSNETALFYYSNRMAQIIEEDLNHKLEDLDFDKDPFQIVGDLIQALQKFDKVSMKRTLNVIRPKLEQWLQIKLVNIREVVSRAITFETWQPISETQLNSESVVNVFYTLNETLENLYDFVGQEIFLRWSKCIQVMIHDVIFEYCESLLKGLDNHSQFKPTDVLPALNLQARKGKKQITFTVQKKNPLAEFTPAMFNQLAGMGSKNFAASNDQGMSIQKLLTRLANLDFINEQLSHLKIRFFSLNHPEADQINEQDLFKTAVELIADTSKSVIKYIANKMVYIDFNDIIFAHLYIGKANEMISLKMQLQNLNNYMRVVFLKTPRKYFKDTLNTLHQTLIDALLRYLMLLSSLGFQLGVACDDFFKNPIILQGDIRELIVFFSPKDRDGNDIGLTKQECEQNSEVVLRFLQYMREDDQMLIALFKSIDQDVQRNKEIISRILYRRSTKDVDKFFEDYKTLFGK